MSALAIRSIPSSSIPEPICDETIIDNLFRQYEHDFPRHCRFLTQWGVITRYNVTKDSWGSSGKVVMMRNISLVAKCFAKTNDYRSWREARTIVYLNRKKIPFITKIYAVSPYQEGPILVFNNEGPDLAYHLENGTLGLKDISIISKQVLQCVDALKKEGVTHNDIKPNNICYDQNRKSSTLIDWEGASSHDSPEPDVTFTYPYRSPENCLQLPCASDAERSKSDVWAVAATIFSILTCQPWIGNEVTSSLAVLHAMQKRLTVLPKKMIDASSIKNKLFKDDCLLPCNEVKEYLPVADHFKIAQEEIWRYCDIDQFNKLTALVLDLLKMTPAERPSAEEALTRHFPLIPSKLPEEMESLSLDDP